LESCEWVADTQLCFSQVSQISRLSSTEVSPTRSTKQPKPSTSQAYPQFIPSGGEYDNEKELQNETTDNKNGHLPVVVAPQERISLLQSRSGKSRMAL
jgi:hypothetical protein